MKPKWVDCTICGAKNNIVYKENLVQEFKHKGVSIGIVIKNLDGYFCSECNDGFYTEASQKKIDSILKEKETKNVKHEN